jgi:hypothetical protein
MGDLELYFIKKCIVEIENTSVLVVHSWDVQTHPSFLLNGVSQMG